MHAKLAHLAGCGWFWIWALVGCAAALGAVSLGPLLLLPVLGLAVFMANRPRVRSSAFGVLPGIGALCLFVAWVQRSGQYVDPRPWLAIGIILVATGMAAHAVHARRSG